MALAIEAFDITDIAFPAAPTALLPGFVQTDLRFPVWPYPSGQPVPAFWVQVPGVQSWLYIPAQPGWTYIPAIEAWTYQPQ